MSHQYLGLALFGIAVTLAGGLSAKVRANGVAETPVAGPEKVLVEHTFDGRPFSYEITGTADKEHCRVVYVRYPSPVVSHLPQNNVIPTELYLPKEISGKAVRRPAVICLHILDGNLELVRMLASVLASRGMAGLVFPLPYYGERGGPQGPRDILQNPERFIVVLEQTYLEVRRATDFLASRPEIDPRRIGVAGISLGAIVAASAAEREPRLWRVALILSGGNIPKIVAHAPEAQPLREFLASLSQEDRDRVLDSFRQADPLALADELQKRAQAGRVLMINAAEDEVIPRECTEELASALGISDKVVWLPGLGHYTAIAALPQILEQTASFFAEDLPIEARPDITPELQKTTPSARIAAVLREFVRFYLEEPQAGTCHLVHFSVQIGNRIAEVLFVRGRGHQFRLEVEAEELGRVAVGQGDYPWIMARTGKVFAGEPNSPLEPKSPLEYVRGPILERLRFAMLAVGGLGATPAALEPLLELSETHASQKTVITARRPGEPEPEVKLVFTPSLPMPESFSVQAEGKTISVTFKSWQLHAPTGKGVFAPPAGKPTQSVPRNDVYRMFGAVMNYGAEFLP